MLKRLIFCLSIVNFFLFSSAIFACFPAKVPLANRVAQATTIGVGFVTGITLEQFESEIGRSADELQIQPLQTHESFSLRVKINENLKGKYPTEIIFPLIANCGSGKADLRQKVVVFFDGNYWFVIPHEETLELQIKTSLEKG